MIKSVSNLFPLLPSEHQWSQNSALATTYLENLECVHLLLYANHMWFSWVDLLFCFIFMKYKKKKKKWKKCSVSSSVLRLLLLQWGIRLEQSQLWTDETCPVTSTRVWSCQASSVCAILKSSGYSILRVVVITSHICRSLKVSCCS